MQYLLKRRLSTACDRRVYSTVPVYVHVDIKTRALNTDLTVRLNTAIRLLAEFADSELTRRRKHAISILEKIYRHGVSPRPETRSRQTKTMTKIVVVTGLRVIWRNQNRRF